MHHEDLCSEELGELGGSAEDVLGAVVKVYGHDERPFEWRLGRCTPAVSRLNGAPRVGG